MKSVSIGLFERSTLTVAHLFEFELDRGWVRGGDAICNVLSNPEGLLLRLSL